MAGSSLAAPHPTIANLYPMVTDSFHTNLILFAYCSGSPDTTANVYEHGCMMVQIDSGTGNKAIYENVGSSASPSWNLIGSIIASEITLAQGSILVGNSSGVAAAQRQYGTVAKAIASTTPGSLFGSSTFPGSITGVYFVNDSQGNAGTVTVKNAGTTIATITKNIGQGSMLGSSIAETAFTSAALLSVETSNANVGGTLYATFITGSAT